MALTHWTCFLLFTGLGHCYVNLTCKNGTTVSQSSILQPATFANDGNRIYIDNRICSHTAVGHSIAWFEVDLGGEYSLVSVKIYYRNESDWPPYRFRQFYLDVSNGTAASTTALTSQRTRCYTDNTTYPATPPAVIDIPCKQTARYVIVETTYESPEAKNRSAPGPVLEICEIEVYGCEVGEQNCSECDIISGLCPCDTCVNTECNRCSEYCTNGCVTGYWGSTCKSRCNQHCLGNTCAQGNGTCANGCVDFYYGYTCDHQCGPHCNPRTCDRVTGVCSACNTGLYGPLCNKTCSPYCKSGSCDAHNGHCTGGCKENWTGYLCDKCDAFYFGPTCSEECSVHCKGRVCNNVTGSCTDGCETGYYKDTCNVTCNPDCKNGCNRNSGKCDHGCIDGKFGAACHNICGSGCISNKCDQTTGSCNCKRGWQGVKCTDLALSASNPPSSEIPVVAIGAGAGGFVFVTIAVIVAVVFFRSRQQKLSYSSKPSVYSIKSTPVEDLEEETQSENPEEVVYHNYLPEAKYIAVKDLLNVIRQKEANKGVGFTKEFKSIPYGERFPCNAAKLVENEMKNRFKTTFPYDHSRVVLEPNDGFTSDYINANYIENMDGRREYIASQGPRENTLVDHWRMIWQDHVQYIVMLTNLIEGPKVKCHQYWPGNYELDVNPFTVTLLEEIVYAYYVIRKMEVRKKGVSESRTIVQFHYTRWPDHGTPNPLNLVIFHRHFRHKIKSSHHPILVHCSAGIGRTGTFIALDVLSRYGDVQHKVNVVEYVKAMRKDRTTMIQNVDQYAFLYHALFEYFRSKGKSLSMKDFMTSYEDLDKPEAKKKITDEFNALKSLQPKYGMDNFKTGQKFLELNLTKSVLPVEKYLVYVSSNVNEREAYYNAVSVSSFTCAEEFISAQYPVTGAAIDLARLLVDQKSPFLISLNPLSDVTEIENWVDGKNSKVDLVQYEITQNTQKMLSEKVRTTGIKIKRKDSGDTHTVQIFECLSWSSSEALPNEHAALTNLIKEIRLDRKSRPEGPMTVVSKDGATCCGVFLAVYNAVEQIKQDDEADIFTIVQQLQCRRPEMVSRKEEYEFCFRTLWYYLNLDSMCANT